MPQAHQQFEIDVFHLLDEHAVAGEAALPGEGEHARYGRRDGLRRAQVQFDAARAALVHHLRALQLGGYRHAQCADSLRRFISRSCQKARGYRQSRLFGEPGLARVFGQRMGGSARPDCRQRLGSEGIPGLHHCACAPERANGREEFVIDGDVALAQAGKLFGCGQLPHRHMAALPRWEVLQRCRQAVAHQVRAAPGHERHDVVELARGHQHLQRLAVHQGVDENAVGQVDRVAQLHIAREERLQGCLRARR